MDILSIGQWGRLGWGSNAQNSGTSVHAFSSPSPSSCKETEYQAWLNVRAVPAEGLSSFSANHNFKPWSIDILLAFQAHLKCDNKIYSYVS
jgi:hypothetical protein